MLKMLKVFQSHTLLVFPARTYICLFLFLAACSHANTTPFPTVALLPTQPLTPTMIPSPINQQVEPTITNTATQVEILPSPTVPIVNTPMVIPSQTIYQGISTYVCPWIKMAQSTPVFTYKAVNSYPHDSDAYTQGLIFRDGFLYEGTGLKGQSSLRKVDLETGEIQQMVELSDQYFGEGITELDQRIYQLTWQEQTGFIYDEASFNQLGTFSYPTEGWGLTHDGKNLIMSDGTPELYFLNPETLQAVSRVTVTSEGVPVPRLNELEYIDGEVWANIYQTSCVARINPMNGQVIGWLDITGILAQEDQPGSEVPNGIAYDSAGKRIFVTGKHWPKLFEILIYGMD